MTERAAPGGWEEGHHRQTPRGEIEAQRERWRAAPGSVDHRGAARHRDEGPRQEGPGGLDGRCGRKDPGRSESQCGEGRGERRYQGARREGPEGGRGRRGRRKWPRGKAPGAMRQVNAWVEVSQEDVTGFVSPDGHVPSGVLLLRRAQCPVSTLGGCSAPTGLRLAGGAVW